VDRTDRSAVALYLAAKPLIEAHGTPISRMELFTGLLVFDPFTVYFRSLLLVFAVLFVLFTRLSGIPDREVARTFTRSCWVQRWVCA